MKSILAIVSAVSAAAICATAQSDLAVTSFSGNGMLTWDAPGAGVYSVEWASSPTGSWSSAWPLAGMTVEAGSHTNAVPMFYRVRARGSELLMHGNGVDGSQIFTDESGHTVTTYGDAEISTNRSKFGGASMYFDGSGDYLSLATNADWAFGDSDFTVDLWVNFETNPGDVSIIGPHTQGLYTEWPILREGSSLSAAINGLIVISQSWAPQTDTWYHIALTRSGTDLRLFVDGQLHGDTTSSATIGTARPLTIGAASNPSLFLRGYIDEIRIIKGSAAWTAPFTPPATEYGY